MFDRVVVWSLRGGAIVLTLLSALGFLNAFYLRLHGPGADLGIGAGILAILAWAAAYWEHRHSV